jgi:hypothetical protein
MSFAELASGAGSASKRERCTCRTEGVRRYAHVRGGATELDTIRKTVDKN